MIDNSGCSLNTAAGKKGAYRDLFYSETPLTQEVILAVCANEKSGIFGEQNWWFNARSYGLCWSLVRSFVHTYLKQDGTPFTAAADYAVKSFAEEMEGRDLRLEQTVRGRNFLWDGKTAVADIKNLSLTGYQVIKYEEHQQHSADPLCRGAAQLRRGAGRTGGAHRLRMGAHGRCAA